MNNTIAIYIGLVILGSIAFDVVTYGGEHLLFLMRKLADLLIWMAFWR